MIHLITKNNEDTIKGALASIFSMKEGILIGDLGSTDKTVEICKKFGAKVVSCQEMRRDEARNKLIDMTNEEMCFYLEPWETLTQGFNALKNCKPSSYNATIIQDGIISKEVRAWFNNRKVRFVNPAFERLNTETKAQLPFVLYSAGRKDYQDLIKSIDLWKKALPTKPQPLYYQSCVLLIQKQYEEFLKISEYYMHMEKSVSMATIMNRYYFAMVNLVYKKKVRPALQNISICLKYKPLMAEFWCLKGDIFYHLLKDFDKAKSFYQNAVTLGGYRKNNDMWPMEIVKYSKYPKRMIESCEKLIKDSYLLAKKKDQ